jgi:hypothetical protein
MKVKMTVKMTLDPIVEMIWLIRRNDDRKQRILWRCQDFCILRQDLLPVLLRVLSWMSLIFETACELINRIWVPI